jgi:prepilin-type processing-associated H-X9-DG protein
MHGGAGNVALGDGSVQQMGGARLPEQVQHQGVATNRLLIP